MTEEMKQNDATRFVVVRLGEDPLLVIDSSDTEITAKKRSEELAAQEDGFEFAVFQKIGSSKLEPKVVWKGASR